MSEPTGWTLIAYDTGDAIALSAVGRLLSGEGIGVMWEPADPLLGLNSPVVGTPPTYSMYVASADEVRARELLEGERLLGVRFVWDEQDVTLDQGESRDELYEWAAGRSVYDGELEVDDPAALEAAEAAVRGDAPEAHVPSAPERDPAIWDSGWRAVAGWPATEIARHRTIAYLGIGSNLGDRLAHLGDAVRALDALEETVVVGVSRVFESEPWGVADQPAFANAVVVVSTAMRADQLFECTAQIEDDLGRERGGVRYGPRVIDIDLLLFGDEEWQRPDLVVPHPRMRERQFVIRPLLEVDPWVTLPDGTQPDLRAATQGKVLGIVGRVPGYERLTPPGDDERPEPLEFVSAFEPGRPDTPSADGGWVAIEQSMQGLMMGYQGAMTLQVHLGVLEAAGIPAVLDPPPLFAAPGMPHYGAVLPIRLMVPAEYERQARQALRDAGQES